MNKYSICIGNGRREDTIIIDTECASLAVAYGIARFWLRSSIEDGYDFAVIYRWERDYYVPVVKMSYFLMSGYEVTRYNKDGSETLITL